MFTLVVAELLLIELELLLTLGVTELLLDELELEGRFTVARPVELEPEGRFT